MSATYLLLESRLMTGAIPLLRLYTSAAWSGTALLFVPSYSMERVLRCLPVTSGNRLTVLGAQCEFVVRT